MTVAFDFNVDPADYEHCRALWASVALRAFEDAVRYGDEIGYSCGSRIVNSLSWFLSKDAADVCGHAGIDHESAHESAVRWRKRFVDSGMTWTRFSTDVMTPEIHGMEVEA